MRTLQPIFGEASSNVLQSLLTAGLLREEEIGLTSAIQFSLDSLAEFSAAYAYSEDCGTELEKWKQFAGQLNEAGYEASGFRAAMACIIETYSTALEMPKSVLTLLSPVKTAAAVEVGADQT